MRKTTNLFKSLSLLSFILISMFPLIAPVKALEMEYFPLAPGNNLFYNSTDDDSTWNTKRYIADETEFLGGPFGTFTVLWCEAKMLPDESDYTWVNQMWLSKTEDTLIWWGFENEYSKIIVNEGLAYVTEPVEVGAIHSGSTIGTLTLKADNKVIPNVPFSANYTIDAIESVTVPAGTFDNCIKVHEEETTPDGIISFWVWYAPNVGAIQYYYPDANNRWDKLTNYAVDIENDPWDSWFLPKVPIVLTITLITVVSIVAMFTVIKVIHKRKS